MISAPCAIPTHRSHPQGCQRTSPFGRGRQRRRRGSLSRRVAPRLCRDRRRCGSVGRRRSLAIGVGGGEQGPRGGEERLIPIICRNFAGHQQALTTGLRIVIAKVLVIGACHNCSGLTSPAAAAVLRRQLLRHFWITMRFAGIRVGFRECGQHCTIHGGRIYMYPRTWEGRGQSSREVFNVGFLSHVVGRCDFLCDGQ